MKEIQKVDLKSKDIKSENINKLKQLFPEIVSEGEIDFDKLKLTFGEEVDLEKERYGMNWAGKYNCFKIIQDRSTGTLKPVRDESIDFDTTKNIFIEGDNLEVLKLLQKSYYEKIKMIYIDPPYNKGKDFVYTDKFGQQLDEYLKLTNQVDSEGRKLSTNTDSNGRYHSNWMNMIYPRLFLAKNLLKADGIIFISIDDNEIDNLKKICNEVFGEENFVANVIWRSKSGGANDSNLVAVDHEYILIYAKDINFGLLGGLPYTDELLKLYTGKDEFFELRGPYRPMLLMQKGLSYSESLTYPIKAPDGTILKPDGGGAIWRWSKDRLTEKTKEGFVEFKKNNGEWKIYTKQYLNIDYDGNIINRDKLLRTVIVDIDGRDGTRDIQCLFDQKIFTNPKPLKLIKTFLNIGLEKEEIILDFFAGSGTTAHAVLDLNKKDNGNRKFILVQLPEATSKDSEAFKTGYKTISDIAKERIRRVINKHKEEEKQQKLSDKDNKQDLGFKVFKLDRSNFKIWDTNVQNIQTSITDHIDQIKKESNKEAVLYEILLKEGMELTTNINKIKIDNKEVYSIENNLLLICLEDKLTLDLFKKMKELNPTVVIVQDKGFNDNDQLKTNAVELMTYVDTKDLDKKEYILKAI